MLVSLLAVHFSIIAKLDLSVDVRGAFADFGVDLRLSKPVESVHILILLVLGEALEDASPVGLFDPLDLHALYSPAPYDLVEPRHDCHRCTVLKLLDYRAGLCDQPQEVEIVGVTHGQPVGLFELLPLDVLHHSGPSHCELRLFLLRLMRAPRSLLLAPWIGLLGWDSAKGLAVLLRKKGRHVMISGDLRHEAIHPALAFRDRLLLLLLRLSRKLITHHLLLTVNSLGEPSILLRLHEVTLHLPTLVVGVHTLYHLQLRGSVLHPTLNKVDLIGHQAETPLHLLLHS